MDYSESVAKYGYPYAIMLIDDDSTGDNSPICEGCGCNRAHFGEFWMVGEIATCPTCMRHESMGNKPRVIHLDEGGFLVLVTFQNGEGYTVGPGYILKEDAAHSEHLPDGEMLHLFVHRAYAEVTKDLLVHLTSTI